MGKKKKHHLNSDNFLKDQIKENPESHLTVTDLPMYLADKLWKTETTDRQKEDKDEKTDKNEKKDSKQITAKTFAHGLMDVALLTSNATQLRCVLSSPDYQFYSLLLFLIGVSIVLQLLAGVMLLLSDYYKTQLKERAKLYRDRRKLLSFMVLAITLHITAANVLISAFYNPTLDVFPKQK
ncbi:hypothetical protein ScPMuIL_007968 [Solemya velum]